MVVSGGTTAQRTLSPLPLWEIFLDGSLMARRRQHRRHVRHALRKLLLVATAVVLATAGTLWCYRSTRDSVSHELTYRMARRTIRTEQGARANLMGRRGFAISIETASIVSAMSAEQKVAQLFFVTPEGLLAGRHEGAVTAAGDLTREALSERPVGGIIYFQQNLTSPDQTRQMLAQTAAFAREALDVPLLLDVDEEGGTVSRIGGNPGFPIANVGNMSEVGAGADVSRARDIAEHVGSYLHDLGFTADFAPVADVANNPNSDTMRLRSFGSDAALVSEMVAAQVAGFSSQHIICCAKHFPGIGGAEGDSHTGAIYTHKSADEMMAEELLPFAAAIDEGVPMVMVGHISCPEVTGNELPASVNSAVMKDLLRDRLGFTGVVVTDSLGMGAIVDRFGKDRVAVEAFLAGADALLMPADFDAAYQGMLDAVKTGEISAERLDASVSRIIRMKLANES